ncbi:MAG: hypothetical protein GYB66_16810, partial [Chloroflexi bacterium]|nr:hypothetical protein [Chloroflexota bacterium]
MSRRIQIYLILIATVVLAGAWRFVGINWDRYGLNHPDERYVGSVTSELGNKDLLLPRVQERCTDDENPDGFFNTRCTALNPVNISSDPSTNQERSFAYGTLPVFMVR